LAYLRQFDNEPLTGNFTSHTGAVCRPIQWVCANKATGQ